MADNEIIETAAIQFPHGGVITYPRPHRHPDIMLSEAYEFARKIEIDTTGNMEGLIEGFLTSQGRFVDRSEAYDLAKAAGQIIYRDDVTPTPGALYTEDLW